MLTNTAKLALGILVTNFTVLVEGWWIFGGAAEAEPVPEATMDEIETVEMMDVEPVMKMSRDTLDKESKKG